MSTPHDDPHATDNRRVALRAMATGCAALFAGVLLLRVYVEIQEARADARFEAPAGVWMRRPLRMAEFLHALPAIADAASDDVVLMVGASDVMNGFRPLVFDAEMKRRGVDTHAYNLGFAAASPYVLTRLVDEVDRAMAARGKRIEAIIVSIPNRTLQKPEDDELYVQALVRPGLLVDLVTRVGFDATLRAAANRVFLGIANPAYITLGHRNWLTGSKPVPDVYRDIPGFEDRRLEIFHWSLPYRGWREPPAPDVIPQLRAAEAKMIEIGRRWLKNDLANQAEPYDRPFDPVMVADLSALVARATQAADTVVVVRMPTLVPPPAQRAGRWDRVEQMLSELLAQLAREHGVATFNLYNAIPAAAMLDHGHPTYVTGAELYSRAMAGALVDAMAGRRR